MARFDFKLQRVLEYKGYKEDQIKIELSQANQLYSQEEGILWDMEEKIDDCLMRLQHEQIAKLNQTISIDELIWYHNYLSGLKQLIARQKKRLEELLAKIEEIRQRLIKASQEKRVLERLKEKKWLEFKEEIVRQEQSFLDEVAITEFRREKDSACALRFNL